MGHCENIESDISENIWHHLEKKPINHRENTYKSQLIKPQISFSFFLNISVWLPLKLPPTWDLACNPGICPEWEQNQGPCGSQSGTQIH